MLESEKQKLKDNLQTNKNIQEEKIPLSHELEVKDLVNPITISRMRILQFSLAALLGMAAFGYYYVYYMQQPTGTELVNEWIEASGGAEAWNNITTGSFQREHTLYSDNGDILKQKTENFFFEKTNGQYKLLTNYSTQDGMNLWMGEDKTGHWAVMNELPADPKEAGKDLGFMCDSKWCKPDCAMKMTLYRLGMPFNLVGDGVLPNLAGNVTVNGAASNMLEVTYRPTVGKDRWIFYADEKTNLINKIEYHHKNDHGHEFPEEMYWSDYQDVDGIKLPHSWTRYWTNGQLLEEYKFKNFNFNMELPERFVNRPQDLDWNI